MELFRVALCEKLDDFAEMHKHLHLCDIPGWRSTEASSPVEAASSVRQHYYKKNMIVYSVRKGNAFFIERVDNAMRDLVIAYVSKKPL